MGKSEYGGSGILPDIWRYADAAYNEPKRLPFVPVTGIVKFYSWKDRTDSAFCSVEGDRVVISSRGTKGNMRAWASNLRGIDRIRDTVDPGIHDGFGEFGRKWIDDIAGIVSAGQRAGKIVILTGHSRGAGAAGARTVFLHDRFKINVNSVIVFGTPNWCDKNIRNRVNCMPVDYTNVNTMYDVVAGIPPQPVMYRPGKEYTVCPRPIVLLPLGVIWLARGIYYHVPETYRRLIK